MCMIGMRDRVDSVCVPRVCVLLTYSKQVHERIVLASMAVSVRVSVFRSRFNVLTIQELMARARGKLGQLLR